MKRRRFILGALAAGGALAADAPAPGPLALQPLLEQAADQHDLHGVLVWQAGTLHVEHYRRSRDKPVGDWIAREVDFGPEVLHDLRSISKSVVALLVGQAVGRGLLDVAQPVLEHFPELADLRNQGRETIRVSHLLDMSSGLAWSETPTTYGSRANHETRLGWDVSPARYILDRPLVAPAGTLFNYNGGLTLLLAEILERLSGRGLLDLARTGLFEPLGIERWEWRAGRHGKPMAYSGLRLRPRDLLRLGQMMLAGGIWQGREIVPAAWVAETLPGRITVGRGPMRYGRQWWSSTALHKGRRLRFTAGMGNGGQRLFIVPEIDLAVVFTAGAYNSEQIGAAEIALFRQIVATI